MNKKLLDKTLLLFTILSSRHPYYLQKMDPAVQLVAKVFDLVHKNYLIYIDGNGYRKAYTSNVVGNSFTYKSHTFKFPSTDNYDTYAKIFSQYSLPELWHVLHQLIPFATNWAISVGDNDRFVGTNTLCHVKIAIKYVEKIIKTKTTPDIQNTVDILTEHKQLQNKYETLLAEYTAIKNMFTI